MESNNYTREEYERLENEAGGALYANQIGYERIAALHASKKQKANMKKYLGFKETQDIVCANIKQHIYFLAFDEYPSVSPEPDDIEIKDLVEANPFNVGDVRYRIKAPRKYWMMVVWLMYEADLDIMPLYISNEMFNGIAKWRLTLGK